ncbi:MAG: efflux RND transporter periplasmic adaptor subunit [Gammaproteobacteria bacterium]|nr:MAG: efflux RND transporter periplasmic adaptor subunit [Gammaproteobacteria bacterium]
MKNSVIGTLFLSLALLGSGLPGWAQAAGDQALQVTGGTGHKKESALKMTPAERRAQGIETAQVTQRALSDVVTAPGEVLMNAYRSAQVTPRVSAQIVARHARLGEAVKQGQPLVTLSSVEVSRAQGNLVESDREWRRVKKLGLNVVSAKRYVAAQVARQRAYAAVRAYGMTKAQIGKLLQGADASRATGEFGLFAPQDGIVISDAFVIGEFVTPGRVLFEVADVTAPWVEAQLSPRDAASIVVGAPARVSRDSHDGQQWFDGKVVQLYYRLDVATRTRSVRIEVINSDVVMPAGAYVDVEVQISSSTPQLAVPREALILMQGSQTVFKVIGDELYPQPVEIGVIHADWTEIKAGLAEGDEIVVKGAFLLKSLLLKSQIGEGH